MFELNSQCVLNIPCSSVGKRVAWNERLAFILKCVWFVLIYLLLAMFIFCVWSPWNASQLCSPHIKTSQTFNVNIFAARLLSPGTCRCIPRMPHISPLLPSPIVAECHCSALDKATVIKLFCLTDLELSNQRVVWCSVTCLHCYSASGTIIKKRRLGFIYFEKLNGLPGSQITGNSPDCCCWNKSRLKPLHLIGFGHSFYWLHLLCNAHTCGLIGSVVLLPTVFTIRKTNFCHPKT